MARCHLLEEALAAPRDRQLSVGETASLVWLLLQGHLDAVPPRELWVRLHSCVLRRFSVSAVLQLNRKLKGVTPKGTVTYETGDIYMHSNGTTPPPQNAVFQPW